MSGNASYFKKNVDDLEGVQRRAVRMISCLERLTAEKKRRLRRETAISFKYVKSYCCKEEGSNLFTMFMLDRTKNKRLICHQGNFRLDVRRCFWAGRTVKHWNQFVWGVSWDLWSWSPGVAAKGLQRPSRACGGRTVTAASQRPSQSCSWVCQQQKEVISRVAILKYCLQKFISSSSTGKAPQHVL